MGQREGMGRRKKVSVGAGERKRAPGDMRTYLRSYVIYDESDVESEMSDDAKQRRKEIDERGIARALEFERQAQRDPTRMPQTNKGYDIESRDRNGTVIRYIEVKAMSGSWDGYGVGLSAAQFEKAQMERKRFWLYVIENAGSDGETLHRIQDPTTRIVEFRFDDGWKDVAAAGTCVPATQDDA